MTHHPIKEDAEGTRVYSNYTRYDPVPDEQRKYKRRKPAVPGAVRWGGVWLLPLPLLPGDERVWPETRPDTDAYEHMTKPRKCRCYVCLRPESERWKEQWRRDQMRVGSV